MVVFVYIDIKDYVHSCVVTYVCTVAQPGFFQGWWGVQKMYLTTVFLFISRIYIYIYILFLNKHNLADLWPIKKT